MDIGCSEHPGYINGVGIGQSGLLLPRGSEGNLVYHPQQQLIYPTSSRRTWLTAELADGAHVEGNTIYTVQTLERKLARWA